MTSDPSSEPPARASLLTGRSPFLSRGGTLFAVAVLMGGIFVIDLLIPLGIATGVLYAVPLVLSATQRSRRVTILVATASSLLTLAKIPLAISAASPDWVWLINRALCIVVIWVVVGLVDLLYEVEDTRDAAVAREQALAQLRVLSGLLPICSSCKRIKAEDGGWEVLEVYIDRHSEASFSHGICEDCRQRLYPGM